MVQSQRKLLRLSGLRSKLSHWFGKRSQYNVEDDRIDFFFPSKFRLQFCFKPSNYHKCAAFSHLTSVKILQENLQISRSDQGHGKAGKVVMVTLTSLNSSLSLCRQLNGFKFSEKSLAHIRIYIYTHTDFHSHRFNYWDHQTRWRMIECSDMIGR